MKQTKTTILSRGGGELKSSLSKANFKPLIATSLALALGVSVAVANPTITTGEGNTADSSNNFGITWQTSNNAYTPQKNGNATITQLFLSFNNAEESVGATEGSNGYAIKASSAIRNLTLTSDKTINLTSSGSLEMRAGKYLSSANDKIITLDLSGVTGDNYALIGNFKTGGGAGNTNIAKFGGNGINGSVTLDGSASTEMYFTGNAGKITGTLSITQNSTNIISFESNGAIGGNVTISQGNTTFKNLTSVGTFNLQGGTRTINFQGSNENDSAPTLTANISLTGGTTTISGLNRLIGDITNTNGNHGTIIFQTDSTIQGSITTNNSGGVASQTTLVFNNNATFENSSIITQGSGFGNIRNRISIANDATFNGVSLLATSNAYDRERKNIIKVAGNLSNNSSITSITSAMNWNIYSANGANLIQNIISLDGSGEQSLSIDNINDKKQLTNGVIYTGNNYIGKGLTTGTNGSLSLASGINDTETYQANLHLTVTGDIYTKSSTARQQGTNYINIKQLTANTITSDGGLNKIIVGGSKANTISGNITAQGGGSNQLSLKGASNSLSNISVSGGGRNTIALGGESATNSIIGNIQVTNTGSNTLTLQGATNTITGNITSINAGGSNAITFESGTSTITGSIQAKLTNNLVGVSNTIRFKGAGKIDLNNSNILSQGATTSITFEVDGGRIENGKIETLHSTFNTNNTNTTISFQGSGSITKGASSDDVIFTQGGNARISFAGSGTQSITGNITAQADVYGSGKTLNTISFGGTGSIAGDITAKSRGNSYGSNEITFGGAGSITGDILSDLTIQGNLANNYDSTNIIAFNGTSSTNTITGSITSNKGTNTITFSGASSTNTITGDILAVGYGDGKNIITSASSLTLGATSIKAGDKTYEAKNLFDLQGNTTFSGANLVIKADNSGNTNTSKQNIFKFGNSVTFNNPISEITAFAGNTQNVLSFDGTSSTPMTIGYLNKNLGEGGSGSNYIGKGFVSGSGNSLALNSAIFGNGAWKDLSHQANVALNITNEINSKGGANYLNIKTLTANTITANSNGRNNIVIGAGNSQVTGDITKSGGGANHFTFSENGGILTLKGSTNQITTLTAYTPLARSTSTSTLVIDGSVGGNSTTIDTLNNGGNLVVNFRGQGDGKNATLKISSPATTSLKGVTLLSDATTGNTLDLTALSNITISEAINVGATQGLNLNLKDTTLTLTNGWTTANGGASVINVGDTSTSSASSILQGGNVALKELNLKGQTSSSTASMTLKNSNTTITTLSASASTNTLTLDSTGNAVNATIDTISGSNLTAILNGQSLERGATLTLNGADNTLQALKLGDSNGNAQSTHNTLNLNSGKTTITENVKVGESNTQALTFNLANGTELALVGGLTKGGNGVANLNVALNSSATLSGGTIGLSNLRLQGNSGAMTFKASDTTIDTFYAGARTNNITLGNDTSDVSVTLKAMGGNGATINALTYTGTGGNQTLTIGSGTNTINTITLSNATNTLAINSGSTTIKDAISATSGQTFNLNLSSDASSPSDTLVTLAKTISNTNGGTINVTFDGGVNPADQLHFSTLKLNGASNVLNTVTSNATNAKIELVNGVGATINTITLKADDSSTSDVNEGGSLIFAFTGRGNSQVTATNGITVGSGATLGISLGGSGSKTISGDITFEEHSTLLVDFLDGNSANATISTKNNSGDTANKNGITIGSNRKSIINFHGTNTGKLNGSGITIAGGDNTINFIGSATMSGVTLSSGTNTINVYGADSQAKAITGTIAVSEIGSINNTINLNDYSTLKLTNGSNLGELKTTATNTLNFLGDNATLQGGFGANSGGTATINVGQVGKSVSGLIVGNVSSAGVTFNAGDSKLTLQGTTNTLTGLSTNSTNGILVLDASGNDVDVAVSNAGGMTIGAGKSITIALHSTKTSNNDATFGVTTGDITVDGTLGIAISGNGSGTRSITSSGGRIAFNSGSTLRVDFLEGSAGSATLEGADFTIGSGRNSVINFYAGSTATLSGGGLVLSGGSNTVNFYGNATLGQITLTSGDNTINVKEGVIAKIENTSSTLGNVTNTINLEEGATLQLYATDNTSNADGSIVTANTNTLNFNGSNAKLQGGFGLSSGANAGISATINVKNTGATITGNVSNASVSFDTTNNSTLTLQGATNTLNALSSNVAGSQIILDTAHNERVSAEITSSISGSGNVGLKFGAGSGAKTFTLSASGNTLSGVEFANNSTNNTLSFTRGGNTITNPFTIAQGQGLTLDLKDNSDLTIANFSSSGGVANLQSTGTATLKGGEANVNSLSLLDSGTNALTLQNSSTTINSLSANGSTSNTLKLDASSNAVSVSIANTLAGNNLAITLAGSSADNTATLTLNGANNAISSLTLGTSSANNTLALNNGVTTISSDVGVGANQGITFDLANGTELKLGGLSNTGGNATLSVRDGANTAVSGTITTSNSGNTTLDFKGSNSSLTLKGEGNTISTLSLGASSSGNTLSLGNQTKTTTISSAVSVNANQGIAFNLADDSSLSFAQNFTNSGGEAIFNLSGLSEISGSLTNSQGAMAINVSDGAEGIISGAISTTDGNTKINFASGNAKTTLALSNDNTISTLSLIGASSNNTLDLSGASSLSISNNISLGSNQALAIKLTNTDLTLADGNNTITNLSVIGGNSGDASSSLSGGAVSLTTLALSATNNATLTLKNSSTTIDTLTSTSGTDLFNALALDTTANAVSATINNLNASNLEIALGGSATNSATLNIGSGNNSFGVLDLANDSTNNSLNNSGNLTISTLSLEGNTSLSINGGNTTIENTIGDSNAMSNGGTLALTLNNGSLYAKGGLDNASASNTINLTLNNATLSLGQTSTITSLNASGNTLVDLARVNNSGTPMPKLARSVSDNNVDTRTTLSATTFTGEATFKLYVSSQEADRVVFNNTSGAGEGVATIALVGGNDVYDITYDASRTDKGNVMVADVSNANGQVKVVAGESMIGVNMIQATITEGETAGQYFVGQVRDLGLNQSYQEVASSALAVNYDLYLANFNSLNKRMGELRESEHSNGVWARVFGGSMSNDFGSGSKTDYVTAQAGYDYSLSIGENARNFMGIALAYGTSNTKGNTIGVNAINATTNSISLDKVNSNMIEVGLYNSYVADSGWYNDTILKFDYIMSEFSLSTDPTRMSETNNFAMVLSDEFGYRYKFGESEKGSWYIDPQVEVAFGYFNQSDFNRAMYEADTHTGDIQASQDAILTLRSRIGASLGKKFTTDKGFASIYVGASYEYDYIEGGNSEASGRVGGTITQLDKVESNGRAVLNVGSNIELTKGARMYIDVEKSFGDKQRTFMQFNLGARYSF